MNLLDLFSGTGAFSLGLERAGFKTVAFCEREKACHGRLKKNFPGVIVYDDITTLTASQLTDDGISVDAICGGFPCQDLSQAGSGRGLAGTRSGLWFEFARLIDEIRPKVVVIENVTALRRKGLGVILRFFASIRYDAEWHCIPASACGAPDIRDRLWIIAYPQHSDPDSIGPHSARMHVVGGTELFDREIRVAGPFLSALPRRGERLGSGTFGDWSPEPRIRRVAKREPAIVDRIKMLGNQVKPIIPEIIGRAIMDAVK